METFKYPNLFKPIILAGVMFRNRIFAAPTGFQDLDRFGTMPPEAAFYYERKARGGVACVTVGECSVDSRYGTSRNQAIQLDDPLMRISLCRVSDAVSRHGAVCSAELQHAGNCANRYADPPGIAYGPVEGIAQGHIEGEGARRAYHEMPEDVIWHTIDKFAKGAAFAKACGFGMATVHGGHGWLISQFLSPVTNTRKDKWGGPDIENRARLAIEVLKAIRKAVGAGFPIEMRISGSECFDGGYGIEEGIKIAKQVEDYVDLLHISAGNHEVAEVFTVTHPGMFQPDGCNVQFAEEIKKHVKCPVAAVGALGDPNQLEDIIASGKADIVSIARGLIADPDLPRKIRTGMEDDINHCLRCMNCFSALMTGGQFYCAINPEAGREAEPCLLTPHAEKKKILIAGGGIAGMQAALTSAGLGHEVILCEKTGRLGGALNCEESVPFKQKLASYLERQAIRVAAAGVDIRLNTEVTPDYMASQSADVLVAALGARPVRPAIRGIDGDNVFSAQEAYISPEKTGCSVVIIGAGLAGVELAIYLAGLGRKVSVVETLDGLNHGGNFLYAPALDVEIARCGIDMNYRTEAIEIDSDGVICRQPAGVRRFPADTVIYATGSRPLWEDAERLSLSAPDYYVIGDCSRPSNIMNATGMGYTLAKNIWFCCK